MSLLSFSVSDLGCWWWTEWLCKPWSWRHEVKPGPHPHCLVPAPIECWSCPCCITHGAHLGPTWVYPCATDYLPCVFLCSECLGQRPGSAAVHRSPGFIAARQGRLCMLQGVVTGHRPCRDGIGGQWKWLGFMFCGACSHTEVWGMPSRSNPCYSWWSSCPTSASESDMLFYQFIWSSRIAAIWVPSCQSHRPSNTSCSLWKMSVFLKCTMLTAVASAWDTVSLIKIDQGPR